MKEKLLLLCFVLMCSFSSYGQSGQVGNISWSITDSVLTFSGSGDMPDIYLYQHPWYPYQSNITKAVIEEGITSIGTWTFGRHENLINIEIPNSVTSIKEGAFFSCYSLVSIKIPNSVTTIAGNTFVSCFNLTEIEIPCGVTSIGGRTFYDCRNLINVKIPNSVTTIGGYAFFGCGIKNIEIPNSVTNIEAYAFLGSDLISVKIPNSVTSIGRNAFGSCRSLTSIEIPNSITSIPEEIVSFCDRLTSVEIPNSVTSVGNKAFYQCLNIKSIGIPNSITSIGDYAFGDMRNLKLVDVYWDEPLLINSTVFQGYNIVLSNVILVVPEGTKALYEAAPVWQEFNIIERPIPESVSIYATLIVGSSIKLNADIRPLNTTHQSVTWSSYSDTVASVDATGKVTAITPGWTTITATTVIGGKTATFNIEVERNEAIITTYSGETSNGQVGQDNIHVSLTAGTLTVNTPDKETVKVYSMTGALLFSVEKSEGKQNYSIPNLSKEIYVVTGSSGWNAKVRNN